MDKNDNLDDLFRIFYAIKNAEGRAGGTLRQYKDNYGYFTHFLDKRQIERKFSNVDRNLIRQYITYMKDEAIRFEQHKHKSKAEKTVGLTPRTINTRLKTLRVLFSTLLEEELTERNPMTGVKNLPIPQERIDVLTVQELKKLLNAPNRSYYAGFRDYTIMHVMLDTMIRVGELCQLKESDFDLRKYSVTVRGSVAKNRKARTLPLKMVTARLVSRLIEANREFNSEYVFLTNYGEQIDRERVRKRFNKFGKVAKIKKIVHPHLLRHTSATMFLEDGGDLRHLQLLLGHSDLRMVLRYTHLSDEAIRRQHDRHSAINQVTNNLNRPRKRKL